MFYWVILFISPQISMLTGTCTHPTVPLKNPGNPAEFIYCHPNNHECPGAAICENLWLGLFVCCASSNQSRKDDPGYQTELNDGFSDSEPSDRHMKNRKNFGMFLPAAQTVSSAFDDHTDHINQTTTDTTTTAFDFDPGTTIFNTETAGGATGYTVFETMKTPEIYTRTTPTVSEMVPTTIEAVETNDTFKSNRSSRYSQIFILQEGTNQRVNVNTYKFPATVTLIKDNGKSLIVDTGLPTDYNLLELFLSEISRYGVDADAVDIVVTTHGHPDHFGHLNLFPSAVQYFGGLMYYGTTFSMSELYNSEIAKVSERISIHKTPGHTAEDLSVVARNVSHLGTVAIVGDLFITKDDIENPEIWQSQAWNTTMQQQHRKIMLCMSDYIVPGHGAMFKVEKQMKKLFDCKGRTNF